MGWRPPKSGKLGKESDLKRESAISLALPAFRFDWASLSSQPCNSRREFTSHFTSKGIALSDTFTILLLLVEFASLCGVDRHTGKVPNIAGPGSRGAFGSIAYQLFTGCLANLRCRVRRCMLSARAVAEILPSHSVSTRWMCSHSRRSTEGGVLDIATSGSPLSRENACRISSTVAGFGR